uniref:WD_REPEATS_REGION domain-containing protein n=1 Tax=Macrostomum lignano TaxID=282301 RepID=A0A1I8I356_9PLAT
MQTSRREELMPSSPVSPAAAAAAADSSSACASNDDDTLHYFRKLLKECRVDEDYDEYLADTGLGQQSPLRPVADSLSGQLMNKLWLSVSPQLVPPEIEEHRATRLPWIIAVSPNGRRLALLKRRQLELYSLKRGLDEALVVIATPPDQFCQWRLMSWSADSQCIAVANSNGGVLVFNIRGQKLCELAPEQHGIQLWRRISEFPFIKASLALEEDMIELGRSRRLLASVLLRNRSRTDCVTSMALSPDGFKLAASYAYGCVSVWTFPAGNLIATFSLAEQCLSSVRSPHLSRTRVLGVPRRLYPGKPGDRPSGVEWWSEAVLIIVRTNGSVSLLDAATCQSIMGSSPEWFEPYPAVTPPQAGQFLILECEVRKRRARRRRLTSGGQVGVCLFGGGIYTF